MIQTGSDPEVRKLRQFESILVISGFGTIAFGLWSIIRAGIYYFLNPIDVASIIGESDMADLMELGREQGVELITNNLSAIITGVLFIFLSIDLLLRLYVGVTARAFGRGRKKRGFFIFLAWLMALFTLSGIILVRANEITQFIEAIKGDTLEAWLDSRENGNRAADVSIFVDITSMLVLVELAVSAMKVRKMRKQLGIRDRKSHKGDYYDDMAELTEGIRSITGDN